VRGVVFDSFGYFEPERKIGVMTCEDLGVEIAEIWSQKVRCSLKMKPRLPAKCRVVLSEELYILLSCFLSPISKNSVLDELRVRRLAVIQKEIC